MIFLRIKLPNFMQNFPILCRIYWFTDSWEVWECVKYHCVCYCYVIRCTQTRRRRITVCLMTTCCWRWRPVPLSRSVQLESAQTGCSDWWLRVPRWKLTSASRPASWQCLSANVSSTAAPSWSVHCSVVTAHSVMHIRHLERSTAPVGLVWKHTRACLQAHWWSS